VGPTHPSRNRFSRFYPLFFFPTFVTPRYRSSTHTVQSRLSFPEDVLNPLATPLKDPVGTILRPVRGCGFLRFNSIRGWFRFPHSLSPKLLFYCPFPLSSFWFSVTPRRSFPSHFEFVSPPFKITCFIVFPLSGNPLNVFFPPLSFYVVVPKFWQRSLSFFDDPPFSVVSLLTEFSIFSLWSLRFRLSPLL